MNSIKWPQLGLGRWVRIILAGQVRIRVNVDARGNRFGGNSGQKKRCEDPFDSSGTAIAPVHLCKRRFPIALRRLFLADNPTFEGVPNPEIFVVGTRTHLSTRINNFSGRWIGEPPSRLAILRSSIRRNMFRMFQINWIFDCSIWLTIQSPVRGI